MKEPRITPPRLPRRIRRRLRAQRAVDNTAGWLLYAVARWRIRRWTGGGGCPLCGRRR